MARSSDIEHSRDEYPRLEGDTIVIGPACFAACDGSVLNWRGVNYVPQADPPGAVEAWKREAERPCHSTDEWPDESPCVCVRGTVGCALTHNAGGQSS